MRCRSRFARSEIGRRSITSSPGSRAPASHAWSSTRITCMSTSRTSGRPRSRSRSCASTSPRSSGPPAAWRTRRTLSAKGPCSCGTRTSSPSRISRVSSLRTEAIRDGWLLVVGAHRPPGEGTVGLDEANAIVRLRHFTRGTEVRSADYAGIAVLGPRARASLPRPGCLFADAFDPAPRAWRAGAHGAARRNLPRHGLALRVPGGEPGVAPRARRRLLRRAERRLGERDHATADRSSGLVRSSPAPASSRTSSCGRGRKAHAPLHRCIVTPEGVVPVVAARDAR